jgi:hypothetical protein
MALGVAELLFPHNDPAGNEFDDAAYNMAAIGATVGALSGAGQKGRPDTRGSEANPA